MRIIFLHTFDSFRIWIALINFVVSGSFLHKFEICYGYFLAHLSWRLNTLWKTHPSLLSLLLLLTFHIFIFFSRTTGPISNKLGTNYLWVKGIQVCSNEGPCPFPRGDNYKIVKIHRWNLKIFFSRTTGPISTKLGTKHPWVKVVQVCSNEGPRPFPREDN